MRALEGCKIGRGFEGKGRGMGWMVKGVSADSLAVRIGMIPVH